MPTLDPEVRGCSTDHAMQAPPSGDALEIVFADVLDSRPEPATRSLAGRTLVVRKTRRDG
jgi:hypothetical protein